MNCLYIGTATGIMMIVMKMAKRYDKDHNDHDTPLTRMVNSLAHSQGCPTGYYRCLFIVVNYIQDASVIPCGIDWLIYRAIHHAHQGYLGTLDVHGG